VGENLSNPNKHFMKKKEGKKEEREGRKNMAHTPNEIHLWFQSVEFCEKLGGKVIHINFILYNVLPTKYVMHILYVHNNWTSVDFLTFFAGNVTSSLLVNQTIENKN